MNALLAFLTSPLFVRILTAITEKFLEWEARQKKESFRNAVIKAIETGDQRALDGGEFSDKEGLKIRE